MRTKGFVQLVTAAALWTSFGLGAAEATCVGSQPVSACNTTCYNNCYLSADISCTTGQGITLNPGYDLDLCGKTITCTSAACYTAAAVTMTGNSSKVYSTANYGKIAGPWVTGINCALKSSSEVTGIKLATTFGASAQNCAKVEGNTFEYGSKVLSSGVANSDRIGDNYFEVGLGTIYYYGSEDISIDHNLFVETTPLGPGATGPIIDVSDAYGKVTVTDNIIMADQLPIDPELLSGSDYANNYCNTAYTTCQDCITSGACQTAQPTFSMP